MRTVALVLTASAGLAGSVTPAGGALAGYEVVVAESALDASPTKQVRADCPAGKRALGAGAGVLDATDAILEGRISYAEPAFDGSHWLVNAQNSSGFAPTWKLRVRLICATAD